MAYMGKIGKETLNAILERHPEADATQVRMFDEAYLARENDGNPITIPEFKRKTADGFFLMGWNKQTVAALAEAGEAAFGVKRILCYGCAKQESCDHDMLDELPDRAPDVLSSILGLGGSDPADLM